MDRHSSGVESNNTMEKWERERSKPNSFCIVLHFERKTKQRQKKRIRTTEGHIQHRISLKFKKGRRGGLPRKSEKKNDKSPATAALYMTNLDGNCPTVPYRGFRCHRIWRTRSRKIVCLCVCVTDWQWSNAPQLPKLFVPFLYTYTLWQKMILYRRLPTRMYFRTNDGKYLTRSWTVLLCELTV